MSFNIGDIVEQSKDNRKQSAPILGIVAITLSLASIGLLFWFYSNINSKLESQNSELKAKLTELEHKLEPPLMVDYRIGDPKVSWSNCAMSNCAVAQSFMPTYDIEVGRVGAAFFNATGTVVFTIRPTADSGEVLATTSRATLNKNGWTELPLEKPLMLTKGTHYFLQWDTVVDEKTLFLFILGSPYPNGHAWTKTIYGWTPQVSMLEDIDFVFKLEPS